MSNEIRVNLGFISLTKTWKPQTEEKEAAWELYIELITRIAIVDLPEYGLLREALSSLYSIFGETRNILKKYGPKVASNKNENNISFGLIAVQVLNNVLRPFLAKWHSALLNYEKQKSEKITPYEHEVAWDQNKSIRKELNLAQIQLRELTTLLEEVIGIDSLNHTIE